MKYLINTIYFYEDYFLKSDQYFLVFFSGTDRLPYLFHFSHPKHPHFAPTFHPLTPSFARVDFFNQLIRNACKLRAIETKNLTFVKKVRYYWKKKNWLCSPVFFMQWIHLAANSINYLHSIHIPLVAYKFFFIIVCGFFSLDFAAFNIFFIFFRKEFMLEQWHVWKYWSFDYLSNSSLAGYRILGSVWFSSTWR